MTEKDKLELRAMPIEKGDKYIPIRNNGKWKWGFFCIPTCKFIEPMFGGVAYFHNNGRARVWENGKRDDISININGKEIFPFKDEDFTFSDGRTRIRHDGKWWHIELNGKITGE